MDYKCTGRCCERLFFPRTPDELKRDYDERHRYDEDIVEIYHMLVLLEEDPLGGWYTCSNYDTETKLCKIYERRPKMCRDFPYDSPCPHCGWENDEFKDREVLPEGGVSFDRLMRNEDLGQ